ncbi:MAG TPA: formate dehydrogenase accessory protein FdhE [Gemmatimonadales bacterium]|nr:formate dehydrogenase accessory protein FdhE [Gemmatimonadales bacterium]
MLWPHARLRRPRNVELDQRLAEARGSSPESEAWLALLEAALAESEPGAKWQGAVPTPAPDRPIKAPLLAGTEITVDGRVTQAWVQRLLAHAARPPARRIDGVALLEAAVNQDDARSDAVAATAGADPHVVRVVGQMAALPLLQACARQLASELPATWWEGYCPLCGAWPVLAEYAGLERQRRLRCGRCGTAWAVPVLRCAFCDETHHEHLGYLQPEGTDEMRKVEVCHTCKGYLKGLATVRPLAPWAILLDDLGTVHLDVAALERGLQRPQRAAYALDARIVAGRRRALLSFAVARRKDPV